LAALGPAEAQWRSKDVLRVMADVAQVALLYALAEQAGERYSKLAVLYARHFLDHVPYPDWALVDRDIWFPDSGSPDFGGK
jgi:hypothetical protein